MQLLLILKDRQQTNQTSPHILTKLKIVQENPFTRVMELWETPDGTNIYPSLQLGSTTTEVSLKDVISRNKPL